MAVLTAMPFQERLTTLRKQHGLTQQALADIAGLHVSQIRKYETDAAQPSVDAVKKLAVALSVSLDLLVFDRDERGPDDDLRLQFEAVKRLNPDERQALKTVIEGVITKHEVRRLAGTG
ncbi:MAG: helix-turn-helix transcriptional regulator [Actinobacteria bacterium]|nr:helix-turn-helix transcriptional regulator [Actinomycetota bacterium]